MQTERQIPTPGVPDRVMGFVLQYLTRDASPKRLARLAESLEREADDLEAIAQRRAGVYSLRDRGLLYGERPQDRDSLEVARILDTYAEWARSEAAFRRGGL